MRLKALAIALAQSAATLFFLRLFRAGRITDFIGNTLAIGSTAGLSIAYGPATGFLAAVLTTFTLALADTPLLSAYIQAGKTGAATLGLIASYFRMLVQLGFVGVLAGRMVSRPCKIGSVLVWAFISQVLGEVFSHAVELAVSPAQYLSAQLPYNSIGFAAGALSSLMFSLLYGLSVKPEEKQ